MQVWPAGAENSKREKGRLEMLNFQQEKVYNNNKGEKGEGIQTDTIGCTLKCGQGHER